MEQRFYSLSFHGKGVELFKIQIVNLILCIVTLGFYYPWARAKTLHYLYSQSMFEDQPFIFTGTGKEMFKGFIRAIIIVALLYGIVFSTIYFQPYARIVLVLIAYAGFFCVIPLALHGTYKYRMSKTLWQGIRFGYLGDFKKLFGIFIGGFFLTFLTCGIYWPWFSMRIRKYIVENIRMGNAAFKYDGTGNGYFIIVLKMGVVVFISYFIFISLLIPIIMHSMRGGDLRGLKNLGWFYLCFLPVAIYYPFYKKQQFDYFVNHLSLVSNDTSVQFRSTATNIGYIKLLIGNLLIVIFSLGLGYPWTITRMLNFGASNIEIAGNISFDSLYQEHDEFNDATGSDLFDMLNFGFSI
ncbi:YjgN family protein [Ferruginibacter albus]|uniref:YjgN family protein n=1 Tax=Ferruginibacter albus TaxID=2875540 RepID=UPI001CC82715|nr:YjgN family protein [Ferruginibacter albus]UAY51966.1 DUF898 domain-containing protein [Ferruginibacter albus]